MGSESMLWVNHRDNDFHHFGWGRACLMMLVLLGLFVIPLHASPGPEQLGIMLKIDNMLEKKLSWNEKAANIEKQFQLAAQAHARWVRVAVLWEALESHPGVWDWRGADKVIEAAHRHQIQMLWIVGGTALWDSTNKDWNGAPKDLANPHGAFPQYVRKLVQRYKHAIRYWEIRNEPNLDKMSIEQYATYLRQAWRVIKDEQPQGVVVLGGLGGTLPDQLSYFRRLVGHLRKDGTALPFEIANFHVYPYHASDSGFSGPGSVLKYTQSCDESIRKTMDQTGLGQMPVWITEIDYPAEAKHQARDPEFHHGPSSQALFVEKVFDELARGHPERKLFYASLLDDFDCGNEFRSTGLVNSDNQYRVKRPKESYRAMSRLLGAASQP
ncbi:MAG: endo-1,4-beta-xylanase [Candidatus Riflebacteria bacterium]|nr:endo-1,4-beta-xylanase [Candidatus Riflebacteria bacterium]